MGFFSSVVARGEGSPQLIYAIESVGIICHNAVDMSGGRCVG
jgi:hypothetical protein